MKLGNSDFKDSTTNIKNGAVQEPNKTSEQSAIKTGSNLSAGISATNTDKNTNATNKNIYNTTSSSKGNDYYQGLLDIANGKYTPSNNGASNMYNSVQGANNKYNNLYDYYMNNSGNMSEQQKSLAQNYLSSAKDEVDNSNNYYQSYLDSVNGVESAKSSQYNAMQNALKYTDNSMQGINTQGISESTKAGLFNNYANNIGAIETQGNNSQNKMYQSYASQLQDNNLNNMKAQQEAKSNEQAQNYQYAQAEMENAGLDKDKADSVYNYYQGKLSEGDQRLLDSAHEATNQAINNSKYQSMGIDLTTATPVPNFTKYNTTNKIREITQNYASTAKEGEIFAMDCGFNTNDHYFIKINGNIYDFNKKNVPSGTSITRLTSKGSTKITIN